MPALTYVSPEPAVNEIRRLLEESRACLDALDPAAPTIVRLLIAARRAAIAAAIQGDPA